MPLPHLATPQDLKGVIAYLSGKPSGSTLRETKAVIGASQLDSRKLAAYQHFGVIAREGDRIKLTADVGRALARADDSQFVELLRQRIATIPAYRACLEWAHHQEIDELVNREVGAFWHDHYQTDLGTDNEKEISMRATCFLQFCAAAELGNFITGRRGQPTRVVLDRESLAAFVTGEEFDPLSNRNSERDSSTVNEIDRDSVEEKLVTKTKPDVGANRVVEEPKVAGSSNLNVFISHGKDRHITEQLKEILTFGKFKPVLSVERESTAIAVPDKVFDDMRSCAAGVIHVVNEGNLLDENGNPVPRINENVLIEIGAALALYHKNFVLLVERGVQLPSNLQGLYRCEYEGDKLDYEATMKLLKTFNEFNLD